MGQAVDFFLVDNPVGTSLGLLLGGCLCGLVGAFIELGGQGLEFLRKIKWYVYVALPIIVFNIPNGFRKHRVDRPLETKMHYTEEIMRRGNFTEEERHKIWKDFLEETVKGLAASAPVEASRNDPPTITE